ncbi:mannan endo-1,4-beta-mannosidase 6-like [Aristolochia californica]|uniref:mannan endo-1,4-beta-mannosidase 6-like n=1 Tax=Aristolochia californica TaxID=171875 RepID=UPI0035D72559
MLTADRFRLHSRQIIGVASVLVILYLNFGGKIRFPIFLRQPEMSFIATNSSLFVDEATGEFFFINGWNSYWLMEESVWTSSRQRVSEMLRRGAEMGMTVCRTWAFSDGGEDGSAALQIAPGVFNERVFQALDFVIVEARRHRIRLILSLVNNLKAFGGKAQYVRWAKAAGTNLTSSPDPFFWHPTIKGYYKDYIKSILSRKNSFSGVKYSEEPAIFAWELMNEPRCFSSSSAPVLQSWIAEMAEFIKTLDRKHLVTVGLEGFYGPEATNRLKANPGEWAASLGSDFVQNSAVEFIDFASVHAYPDSWIPNSSTTEKAKYLANWVDTHVYDGEYVLKKPVLFTEVGSTPHMKEQGIRNRDLFLKTVYDRIYESAKKGQAGAGALIWQLLLEGMEEFGDEYSLVAWEHSSTYKLIVEQSCRLRHLFEKNDIRRKIGRPNPCAGPLH